MLVSLALMVLDHRQHHLEALRSALVVVTYPLQRLAQFPVAATEWVSQAFAARERLQKAADDLHEQNLLLRARLQKLEALEAENLQLRNLLDSSIKVGERVLIGELIDMDLDPYTQRVTINKGSTSGVYEGQPVLDAEAVMGQVVQVTPFSAQVLLVTDPSHAIPIQVQRNGLRSIAVGTGRTSQLELPYLPINADIREGDVLITSGLGGTFPAGYPVATVQAVSRRAGEAFPYVLATPRAHLDRAREVLLVWTVTPLQAIRAQEEARTAVPAAQLPEALPASRPASPAPAASPPPAPAKPVPPRKPASSPPGAQPKPAPARPAPAGARP